MVQAVAPSRDETVSARATSTSARESACWPVCCAMWSRRRAASIVPRATSPSSASGRSATRWWMTPASSTCTSSTRSERAPDHERRRCRRADRRTPGRRACGRARPCACRRARPATRRPRTSSRTGRTSRASRSPCCRRAVLTCSPMEVTVNGAQREVPDGADRPGARRAPGAHRGAGGGGGQPRHRAARAARRARRRRRATSSKWFTSWAAAERPTSPTRRASSTSGFQNTGPCAACAIEDLGRRSGREERDAKERPPQEELRRQLAARAVRQLDVDDRAREALPGPRPRAAPAVPSARTSNPSSTRRRVNTRRTTGESSTRRTVGMSRSPATRAYRTARAFAASASEPPNGEEPRSRSTIGSPFSSPRP